VPSTKLYEGDFCVLTSMFEKFESKLNLMESAISNVARDTFSIRSKVVLLVKGLAAERTVITTAPGLFVAIRSACCRQCQF